MSDHLVCVYFPVMVCHSSSRAFSRYLCLVSWIETDSTLGMPPLPTLLLSPRVCEFLSSVLFVFVPGPRSPDV